MARPTSKAVLSLEEKFAAEAGLTLSQVLDETKMPTTVFDERAVWRWEFGKSLLPPDDIEQLPTRMRNLHSWYMEDAKKEMQAFSINVTEDHFAGRDEFTMYYDCLLYTSDAADD